MDSYGGRGFELNEYGVDNSLSLQRLNLYIEVAHNSLPLQNHDCPAGRILLQLKQRRTAVQERAIQLAHNKTLIRFDLSRFIENVVVLVHNNSDVVIH